MSATNQKKVNNLKTHEGGRAIPISEQEQLERSVMTCMLWEDSFYESGEDIAKRIHRLAREVGPEATFKLAAKAKVYLHLRHAPMWLVLAWADVATKQEYRSVINRVDDIPELLAMYWKEGKKPIPKQMKIALGDAFRGFDEYQLAKYNRKKEISLRDVMRLTHPKPSDPEQAALWKRLIDGELKTPDTWEVSLSAGQNKNETFTRMLYEGKLGGLALLRNLRNMIEAEVSDELIREGIRGIKNRRLLPFQFFAAAKFAPRFEPELDVAMKACLKDSPILPGKTIFLVDISASMTDKISEKSKISMMDAGCALAALGREVCEVGAVYSFSDELKEVPPRRGFALRDAILNSQRFGCTYLGAALKELPLNKEDRLIVFTDEQSHDKVNPPKCDKAYMVNVASNTNGVGYRDGWTHIDGFSESIIKWIITSEGFQSE